MEMLLDPLCCVPSVRQSPRRSLARKVRSFQGQCEFRVLMESASAWRGERTEEIEETDSQQVFWL